MTAPCRCSQTRRYLLGITGASHSAISSCPQGVSLRHTSNLAALEERRVEDVVNISGGNCHHKSKLNYLQIPCTPDDAYQTL